MNQFLLLIMFGILTISFLIHFCIQYATDNEGLCRFLNTVNIFAVIIGSIVLHSLWQGAIWVKWTLALGIPMAFFAFILLITLFFDTIVAKSFTAATEDINHWLFVAKNYLPSLKQDIWSFVKYCIIDENDPYTKELFHMEEA